MSDFIERIISKSPYIIAEIGINHNGDVFLAKEMIDAAKESGADCVKFQNFCVENYISRKAGKALYQEQETVKGKTQFEIIKACEISKEETIELRNYADMKRIDFLSTPFEIWSFHLLRDIGVPAVKISSCNLTNYPFLDEIAASGLPVLLSTGMGDMYEVIKAVEIFKENNSPLLLFQCTSNYPSRIENANLRVIQTYKDLFEVPVGFSDHTVGYTAAIAAVALGAVAIEKHFTVSRNLPGIDQNASIEPLELKECISAARACKAALGNPLKRRSEEEEDTRIALRRSLVAARDIMPGESLTENMIAIKRPGNGLSADFLPLLIGRKIRREIEADDLISMDDFLE